MAEDILSYFNFHLTHPQETALAVCMYLAQELYKAYPDHPKAREFNEAIGRIDDLCADITGDKLPVNDNHDRARNIRISLILLKRMAPYFKKEQADTFVKTLANILADADIIIAIKHKDHPLHFDLYQCQCYDLHEFLKDVNQYIKVNRSQ